METPSFAPIDALAAAAVAAVFVVLVSLFKEPTRQRAMAIFVAGAGAAYLNGGLGLWEFPFCAVATCAAYAGLRSYRWIGIAWLLHVGWDLAHHFYGRPILFFVPTSSGQCAVSDTLIAIWFFAGAPSVFSPFRARPNQISSDL